jgi:hypothetical protein
MLRTISAPMAALADVKGSPEDEQAIRQSIRYGQTSNDEAEEQSEKNVENNADSINIFGGWVAGRPEWVCDL